MQQTPARARKVAPPAPPSTTRPRGARRERRPASVPARRRGVAPGYTLIEMIGVVIIAAILLKMVVPNLLGGSEAARKNTLINDLKGYHSQAALHYQDFQQFPTAIQATGTPTASTMTYATSPGVGLRITGVSQQGYTVRARSTELRKWECTMTISKTSGYNPVCTELSAEWTGSDPSA
jgi:type II secretory pathway pseudopilin PulG